MLRATILLTAIPTVGQVATGIHLSDVRFHGDMRSEGVDLEKCAEDLKSRLYVGTEWTEYFVETVRTKCLLDKGYFKAAVKASTQQLPDSHSTHQFAITFDIDAGPRYRLGDITFKNAHAISNAEVLRAQFPIKDGDILDRNAIAKGLENLRYAYGQLGYINFTSVPSPTFDDEKKLGFLEVYLDEGKQFVVSSIDIIGADPQVLNDRLVKPGQIYNVRLVNLFLQRHLPGADVSDPRIQRRRLSERNGTVALTFDFRSWP